MKVHTVNFNEIESITNLNSSIFFFEITNSDIMRWREYKIELEHSLLKSIMIKVK